MCAPFKLRLSRVGWIDGRDIAGDEPLEDRCVHDTR